MDVERALAERGVLDQLAGLERVEGAIEILAVLDRDGVGELAGELAVGRDLDAEQLAGVVRDRIEERWVLASR